MTSDGESKGCGIVQMETLEGVEEVIRLGKDGQFSVVEGETEIERTQHQQQHFLRNNNLRL